MRYLILSLLFLLALPASAAEYIVELNALNERHEFALSRQLVQKTLTPDDLAEKRRLFGDVKARANLGALPGVKVVKDYRNLDVLLVEADAAGVALLEAHPDVTAVNDNFVMEGKHNRDVILEAHDVDDLISAGYIAPGVTVAIADSGYSYPHISEDCVTGSPVSGVDYDDPGCPIIAYEEIATSDGVAEWSAHGSHGITVTAIANWAMCDAPGTYSASAPYWADPRAEGCGEIAVLDVWEPNFGIPLSNLVDAVDWVIDNAATYNIRVLNLSLGDISHHVTNCSDLGVRIGDAEAAGVLTVASSGNDAPVSPPPTTYEDGIIYPACIAGVLPVGAAAIGSVNHGSGNQGNGGFNPGVYGCDTPTGGLAPGEIACFSQTWPGDLIVAGGVDWGGADGTSFSAPVVSAAAAHIASTHPHLTPAEIKAVLLDTATSVDDERPFLSPARPTATLALLASLDKDGDGVNAYVDNCTELGNASQCDTDSDGYGNHCDGDFDQSNTVNSNDYSAYFLPAFQSGNDSGRGEDMDCSGGVNSNDYGNYFLPQFSAGEPGPSN